jgi:hypothetical protein
LNNIVTIAQGASLLPGADKYLLHLFQLLGAGEMTRDGAAVTLHCRLPAEPQRP